ncbi:MAG: hypothetical protein V4620_13090 [Bacteroidota bacterium]
MKNKFKYNSNEYALILKFSLLALASIFFGSNKLMAQVEGQYDTLNIGIIDTNSINGFVSYYEPVEISTLDETVINLNTVLEIQELIIGTKYSTTITYTNPFNYDLVFNTEIKKPTSSCSCLKLSYSNTVVSAGGQLAIQIDILPFVSGNKNVIIELPILKKSTVASNPPTIVSIKPIKFNFKVKE